jgi:hypothetical protein
MLAASEFSIGFIGGVEALTLVLPIEKHDQAFLIVPAADGPIASTNFSPSRAAGMRVTNESWWPRFRSKWISHRSTSHHFPVRAQWFVGETVSSWRRALIECRSHSCSPYHATSSSAVGIWPRASCAGKSHWGPGAIVGSFGQSTFERRRVRLLSARRPNLDQPVPRSQNVDDDGHADFVSAEHEQ